MIEMLEATADLLIIRVGPAGLAAAVSAAQAGVQKILLLDRLVELGGILPQCIHNGFGLRYFQEKLTGPEYAARFIEMVAQYPQITVKLNTMVIDLKSKPVLEVTAVNPHDGLVCYHPKALILAMGCRERPRGTINIPGTRPAGIYSAGTVQRMINIEGYRPGERAVILGSGDIGLIIARRLTLEGIQVPAVVELQPYSSDLARNLVQCLDDFQIPLYLSHTVTQILGDRRVDAVRVAPSIPSGSRSLPGNLKSPVTR
jgi:NADPH-dependent 2,4-dienoyl-CoA reductase/sulfur reductase-like enzyme